MSRLFSSSPARKHKRRLPLGSLILVVAGLVILFRAVRPYLRRPTRPPPPHVQFGTPPPHPYRRSTLTGLIPPTPQRRFLDPDWQAGVQPTATGNPESALYGSTRTGANGLPTFHEGLDIAVVHRDRKGQPTDPVMAVADGQVAYLNPIPGDSNYGRYIVLLHEDPVGDIYTLYAHLSQIAPDLSPGAPVHRGERLGTVGNTPSDLIPLSRAHLHFEIGLVMNSRYAEWAAAKKLKNLHGQFNGGNLAGLDPLELFHLFRDMPDSSLNNYLDSLPVAFSLVLSSRKGLPDFFQRYPSRWKGPLPTARSPILLSFSEGGVPLQGRLATSEETERLGRKSAGVIEVDEAVLGRNGRRLIVRQNGVWTLSTSGEQWLDLLLFQ